MKTHSSILTSYIKAGNPIIYFNTPEEDRAEIECFNIEDDFASNKENPIDVKIGIWTCTKGLIFPNEASVQQNQRGNLIHTPSDLDYPITEDDQTMQNPISMLGVLCDNDRYQTKINSDSFNNDQYIFVLKDFHPYFENTMVRRMIRDIVHEFKNDNKKIIFLSPIQKIHEELEKDIVVVDLKLPDEEIISEIIENITEDIGMQIEDDEMNNIIQASKGLTVPEVEASFSKALVDLSRYDEDEAKPSISSLVMVEKAQVVKKNGILEYINTSISDNDVGGLEFLVNWLKMRSKAFSKRAREFGLPMPKGILLAGPPGCGKSLISKVTAHILNVPLIRFDLGKVFAGIVGQSENNMRSALNTIEAIGSCVIWVDEIEKAMAGVSSSGNTDSGVTARVFGSFLTWMQEKQSSSFIVATVNNQQVLPPEMLRKGRFDEIFFVGLPNLEERKKIFEIHIGKKGRNPEDFDIDDFAKISDKFSGAEIEESINNALYSAFSNDTDLNNDDIKESIGYVNPLANARKKEVESMIEWAQSNAMSASYGRENTITFKPTSNKRRRKVNIDKPNKSGKRKHSI